MTNLGWANPYKVVQHGAFPGFVSPEDGERIRTALSNPPRPRFTGIYTSRECKDAIVPRARCAFEVAPGERCGRIIRPKQMDVGTSYVYRGTGCPGSTKTPHFHHINRDAGEHVLEILQDVFLPERLAEVADRVQVDSAAIRARRRALKEELETARADRDGASGLILEATKKVAAAERAGDLSERDAQRRLVAHWEGVLSQAAGNVERLGLQAELYEVRQQEYEEACNADLGLVMALATNLPALLERARAVEGFLAQIVARLTKTVWMRRLGEGMYEVEVEFPSGERVGRIFQAGQIRIPQPCQVYAHARLAAGAKPALVAEELTWVTRLGGTAVRWNVDRVRGAAAEHEYFPEDARKRVHWSAEALALKAGEEVEVVTARGLAGDLGPALWIEGVLRWAPTKAELHRAFPTFAMNEVARRSGRDPADLILAAEARQANRDRPFVIQAFTADTRDRWYDASGRLYVLRSNLLARGFSTDAASSNRARTLAAINARLQERGITDLRAEDFMSVHAFLTEFRPRFPFISPTRLRRVFAAGHLTVVPAIGLKAGGGMGVQKHLHVPDWVRTETDSQAISDWLWPSGWTGPINRAARAAARAAWAD